MQNSGLAQRLNNLADAVVGRVEALRDELDTNPEFRSAVRRSPSGPQIQRGTRFIWRELVRALLVDNRTKITRNHAIDLLHAVVPVAYCDLVLLDKHWETQVDRVRSRLKAACIGSSPQKSSRISSIIQYFSQLHGSSIVSMWPLKIPQPVLT